MTQYPPGPGPRMTPPSSQGQPQQPYGQPQAPYGEAPHGQPPYGQQPYGPRYGQSPYGPGPYSQPPQGGGGMKILGIVMLCLCGLYLIQAVYAIVDVENQMEESRKQLAGIDTSDGDTPAIFRNMRMPTKQEFILPEIFRIPGNLVGMIAGIGLIRRHRVMGFILGNVYGVLAILGAVGGFLVLYGPMNIFGAVSLLGAILPIVVLALVNGKFKDRFES